jgi:hypothetical protein
MTTSSVKLKTNLRQMIDELTMDGPVVVMGWSKDGTENPLIFAKGTQEQLLRLNAAAEKNFKS